MKRLNKKTTVKDTSNEPDDDKKRKSKAANTIAQAFRNTAKLKVTEIQTAFDKKLKSVKVKPRYMGKQVDNLGYVIFKAFQLARKEISDTTNYYVYGECTYNADNEDGSTSKYNVTRRKENKQHVAKMYSHLRERIYAVIQSGQVINLSTLAFTFHFITIPSGGASSTSREKQSLLNKTSVNLVVNDDNNCFWHALVMLVYANHAQIKTIKMGRKIRTTLAKELCDHCQMEWDKRV